MVSKKYLYYHILFVAIALASSGCRTTAGQIIVVNPQHARMVRQEPFIIPTDTSLSFFEGLQQKASVAKYYRTYGRDPIWIDSGRYSVRADSLMVMIDRAQYYGFQTGRYHVSELVTLKPNLTQRIAIRKELLLTDAFLSIAADLRFGCQESPRKESEDSLRIVLLRNVVSRGGLLKSLELQEPVSAGYRELKTCLEGILDSVRNHDVDSISMVAKIRLIAINLERWRREEIRFGSRHIFINIPSYMIRVIDSDSTVLSSRAVVGTPETQTPVMSGVVECFSIYPYWHVPRKIAVDEYLPTIKRDAAFLRRNNFDVLDRKGNVLNADSVKWNTFHKNYFPVTLRQQEGTENSLGIIKFIFDNPYAVFLHDTNAKRLFKNKDRALSHGCIRMEKAAELAHYLVVGVVGTESKTINKYLNEKQQRWVDLKRPIPIYIRYFTCDVEHGTLVIYTDIYGLDQPLYDVVYKQNKNQEL